MRAFPAAAFLFLAAPSAAASDAFAVQLTGASGTVGDKATASVTIVAKQGWHLNHEAPLTLKLTPPPGVTVDKTKLARADLALLGAREARFDVGVTLAEPGKKSIAAEAGFVLCRADACKPIKEKLTLTAEATAARIAPSKRSGKKK
ncbi:MAG: hypothetical protein JXP73_05670 [Deltaproteobacteria bacterium]|jgi:hypothetical protein|nr:hypothetical protein [Deltaproteobacteria bacterium]